MIKENKEMKLSYLIRELVWTSTLNYDNLLQNQDIMKNKAWVLLNWDIDIEEIPKYQKTYTFSTEVYGFYKFYAMRDFSILDGEKEIIKAKSLWTMIDLETRSITRIPEEVKESSLELTRKDLKLYQFKLPELDIDEVNDILINNDCIDLNSHVSNAVYLQWLENSLTYEEYIFNKVKNIKIIYKKEIKKDEEVIYRKIRKENFYYFDIINKFNKEIKASIVLELEEC